MTKYEVVIMPEAEAGTLESFDYIRQRAPVNAARWLRGLYAAIDTLEYFPERCGYAREREFLGEDLRQLVFKSHRVVFRVNRTLQSVEVIHVRHSRRLAIGQASDPD